MLNLTNQSGYYAMSVQEQVIEALRGLPSSEQQKVLTFVRVLRRVAEMAQEAQLDKSAGQATAHRRSPRGILADIRSYIGSDEIAVARKEMWANFPRDEG
jgi:hypothetical protein